MQWRGSQRAASARRRGTRPAACFNGWVRVHQRGISPSGRVGWRGARGGQARDIAALATAAARHRGHGRGAAGGRTVPDGQCLQRTLQVYLAAVSTWRVAAPGCLTRALVACAAVQVATRRCSVARGMECTVMSARVDSCCRGAAGSRLDGCRSPHVGAAYPAGKAARAPLQCDFRRGGARADRLLPTRGDPQASSSLRALGDR